MEYYRYQVKSRADFEKFIAWLIENKITFTSQHNYVPSAGDHIYHITVYAPKNQESEIFGAIGAFLDQNADIIKVTHMPSQVTSAEDAVNDIYADAETLREAAKSLFTAIKTQSDEHKAMTAKLNVELAKVNKDKSYYLNRYCEEVNYNNRVKEQVQSIAVLMDAIFPREKK